MARMKNFDEQEVLEKILALFSTKGFHKSSLEDILKVAGIGKQSIYDTFGDKKTLFIKVLTLSKERSNANIDNWMETELYKTSSYDALKNMLFFTDDDSSQHGCFILNSKLEFRDEDEQIKEIINSAINYYKAAMRRIIQFGIERGELTEELSTDQILAVLINARNGILAGRECGMQDEELSEIADLTTRLILKKKKPQ